MRCCSQSYLCPSCILLVFLTNATLITTATAIPITSRTLTLMTKDMTTMSVELPSTSVLPVEVVESVYMSLVLQFYR